MDQVERSVGLRRKGTPTEIAYLALYLTSAESSFTTGAVHVCDGGPVGTGSSGHNKGPQ
jgi:hypothetical protein